MTVQEFESEVQEATRKGWLTNKQRNALLQKYENIVSTTEDKKALDMQLRNSLRIMRNTVTHRSELIQDLTFKLVQISKFEKFLEVIDKPKGVLCYRCKIGLVSHETTSSWMRKKDYQLILEQIPASICKNPNCKEIFYSSEVVGKKHKITQIIDDYLAKLHKIKPAALVDNKCPLCLSSSLRSGHKGSDYRFQQTLYHLSLENIPLKAYCEQCGYKELDDQSVVIIDWLVNELNQMVLDLLNTD